MRTVARDAHQTRFLEVAGRIVAGDGGSDGGGGGGGRSPHQAPAQAVEALRRGLAEFVTATYAREAQTFQVGTMTRMCVSGTSSSRAGSCI